VPGGCNWRATEATAENLDERVKLAKLKSQEARQARLSAAQLNRSQICFQARQSVLICWNVSGTTLSSAAHARSVFLFQFFNSFFRFK
jgi:hypothetical protein